MHANGVDGECGTGTCQASSGVALCTFAAPVGQLATVATKSLPALEVESNPAYNGDPAMGCESDVQAVKVQDISGTLCSQQVEKVSHDSNVAVDEVAGEKAPAAAPLVLFSAAAADKGVAMVPGALCGHGKGEGSGHWKAEPEVPAATFKMHEAAAAEEAVAAEKVPTAPFTVHDVAVAGDEGCRREGAHRRSYGARGLSSSGGAAQMQALA